MLGYEATAESTNFLNASQGAHGGWMKLLDLDAGTCPKCFAPIEPERLPRAKLCLDCNVVR